MKIRLSLLSVVFALAAGLGVRAAEPETELGRKMEKINGAFRALRNQVADASKNADSLAKVAIIKENATASLKLEPAKKADIPAADQAKFVADFQTDMKKFVEQAGKLEAAFKANNNEEAGKLLETMGGDQKKSHKAYKKSNKKN